MRYFLAFLFIVALFQSALFAQNNQAVFRMELEAVPGSDEVIANLIAVEFDSVIGFHFGLVWDTTYYSYVGVENYGPLYVLAGSYGNGLISEAHSQYGILQSLWVAEELECASLTPESTMLSFRLKTKQSGGVIKMETELLQIPGSPFTSFFEMVHCDGYIMDVQYVSNLMDTIVIINGIIVSIEDANNKTDIQISPNPTSGLVTLAGLGGGSGNWQLWDTSGRVIQEGAYQTLPFSLDFSEVGQGIYFLRFGERNGHPLSSHKLVISR